MSTAVVVQPLDSAIDLLDLHRLAPQRYPMLLESTAHGTAQGRVDMLGMADGASITLHRDGRVRDEGGNVCTGDFFATLDARWRAAHTDAPPFCGWALYLGYELAAQVEPILQLPHPAGDAPIAQALRCPVVLVRDPAAGTLQLHAEPGTDVLQAQLQQDLAALAQQAALPTWQPPAAVDEDAPHRFTEGVRRVLDYLRAGDVFQVNLSRAWSARFDHALAPAALFARLRQHNPAPFAGVFAGEGWAVVSASPERLVSVHGDIAQTRPIAGTRPRFPGDDDAARVRELVGHPKERAEHVMLIDLERNDLSRVCRAGTVVVDELMTVESYAHVHHIVSNVRGRLRDGVTPGEVLRAVFPGGTITGCPKVRCMQIVAELEQVGRGAYTGSMGWLAHDGDMDLNILIRSAAVQGDTLRFRTGAGIVIDSDPQKELDETRAKARGMLRALGVAA